MKITTFNTFNLIPVGKVKFRWNSSFKRDTEIQNVLISEINIMCDTDRSITPETEKVLLKMMKDAKSDLLTDGRDFYTTRGNKLTQINHGCFNSILEMNKKEVNELLYK